VPNSDLSMWEKPVGGDGHGTVGWGGFVEIDKKHSSLMGGGVGVGWGHHSCVGSGRERMAPKLSQK